MEKARTDVLYYALKEKGYPDDFCREIAYKQMNTDYTATRMLGYLYRVSNPRPEDVVDEMLAIDHSEKRTGTCTGNNQPDLQRRVVTVRICTKEEQQ